MPLLPRDLRDFHANLGARFLEDRITGYSSLEAEDKALRATCGLLDRSDRGKLRLTGSERASFIHGLVTNDIKSLEPGRGAYTAILNPKGHLIADARILVRRDDLLLDVEPGREGSVREHLEHHLISEDVEVHDITGDFALFSLVGPKAAEALPAALGGTRPHLDEHHHADRDGALVIATRLGALEGLDLLVPSGRAVCVLQLLLERGRPLGVVPVGLDAVEIARVEAGVPRFSADMDEETIPLEANLSGRAISFTKGCYVGQEVIARASFRGGVRRKLVGLRLAEDAPPPPSGTHLFKTAGDLKPAVELTTALRSPRFGVIALGYARREYQQPGMELVTAEGRRATVCALPFA
ncbi:MAG: aminomethyl transferase family protein [Deltaproteobacteria bacterium]|nr:aminomethyl transferase family protein [Deltaproteobacteria bacterium]